LETEKQELLLQDTAFGGAGRTAAAQPAGNWLLEAALGSTEQARCCRKHHNLLSVSDWRDLFLAESRAGEHLAG